MFERISWWVVKASVIYMKCRQFKEFFNSGKFIDDYFIINRLLLYNKLVRK